MSYEIKCRNTITDVIKVKYCETQKEVDETIESLEIALDAFGIAWQYEITVEEIN